jgi:hypothetical protein
MSSRVLICYSYFRRRVSARINTARTASQRHHNSSHWSRRVTADNPHGFTDSTIAKLRAIEDPVVRENAEKDALDVRRRSEKRRSDAEVVALRRDKANERSLQRKINAGYVKIMFML